MPCGPDGTGVNVWTISARLYTSGDADTRTDAVAKFDTAPVGAFGSPSLVFLWIVSVFRVRAAPLALPTAGDES